MYGAETDDSRDYWINMWKKGSETWQLPQVTKLLSNNRDIVLAGKHNAQVFIPLCGKAHELKWFLDLGHRVVGVEFIEDCVRDYFSENNLEMEETTCPVAKCKVLQTPDNRLRVFICSIFVFKRECAGPMDIVWDRSGFTAIPEKDRAKYAAVLKSLLAPGFSYGMRALVYDVPSYKMSPRSTDEDALQKHFGDVGKLRLIESTVVNSEEFLGGAGPVTYSLWHLSG